MSIFLKLAGALGIGGVGLALAIIPGAATGAAKLAGAVVKFVVDLPWAKIWWLIPCGVFLAFAIYYHHGKAAAEKQTAIMQAAFAQEKKVFQAEQAAFSIEKASLEGARRMIDDNNRRILAGAADLDQAKKDAATADARNADLARSADARIAALQAASRTHKAPCVLSDEAKRELENQ